ncbi:L,D-transpeptidase (plasmid) [Acuticoccus sp. MNP-M23]|uniref:L,D-transpeptidase n=1 Tax=Acuticoccus sp. MNP-M23 TaxID=3072793 RepID=UPI002814BCD4|nr:L,D-transpeptidase [Acuticoccus sp. MNP-M23]WMS45191.1 L,D-transpeptidase [Acuticoccus sp. MNP-M23]
MSIGMPRRKTLQAARRLSEHVEPSTSEQSSGKIGRAGRLSRRMVVLGVGAATLAGCQMAPEVAVVPSGPVIPPDVALMYGPRPDERFPIPAVDISKIEPRYWRRLVPDPTDERPGTIVVDTVNKFLYLVRADGQAMRYGIGVGRQGFSWSGTAIIRRKQAWPTWTPPAEMIAREPELEKYRNGMPPGLGNALGARALYLYRNGKDTLYRLHGTQQEYSIGRAVSSGCVRLINQDIIDLFDRIPIGTRVIVRPANEPPEA